MYLRYQKTKGESNKNKSKNEQNKNQRRKLKNENLQLILNSSESLLEDFIELDAQFIGKLQHVSNKIDITVKQVLIDLMRNSQSQNILPKIITPANDAIVRINAYILELLIRDTEEMITAIPVHNISNVCYAQEAENSHVIAIQNGDSYEKNEYFDILLIVVNTEKEAGIICQLMKKCFELLYIERTMSLLDQVIGSDDGSNSNCSTSISVVARKARMNQNKNSNMKVKNIDDVKSMVSMTINNPKKVIEKDIDTQSENKSLNESAYETIEEFISQLRKELTKAEYESFGLALAEWQRGQPFEQFCKKALKIVGNYRMHILIAMIPFVPTEKLEWFKQFTKSTGSEQMYAIQYFSSDSSNESFSDNDDEPSVKNFYFTQQDHPITEQRRRPSEISAKSVKSVVKM